MVSLLIVQSLDSIVDILTAIIISIIIRHITGTSLQHLIVVPESIIGMVSSFFIDPYIITILVLPD